jgi:UDP-glucose 4-epimerase
MEKMRILITGGTGSVGKNIVKKLLQEDHKVTVLSRDEAKQHEMKIEFKNNENLIFIPCDIRDRLALSCAFKNHTHIIHTAAFKHVPVCQEYPLEAVKTNILGAENVVQAAIDNNIKNLVAVSTDKACNPFTTMGISKAMQERLIKNKNFKFVRYGNLFTSRGSVLHLFKKQILAKESITITTEESTRFVMTMEDAVNIVLYTLLKSYSQVYMVTPNTKAVNMLCVADCAKHILNPCEHQHSSKESCINFSGLREGEKTNEYMLNEEEGFKSLIDKASGWITTSDSFNNGDFPKGLNSIDRLMTLKETHEFVERQLKEIELK